MAHTSKNGALMATALIEDLARLVEQHGDLPVLIGLGRAPTTPYRPKVMAAVREEHVKTSFLCHRPLLSERETIPVIHLG